MKRFATLAALLVFAAAGFAQETELKDGDVKDLQKVVEDIRGLRFKHDVKVGVQDEKDLGKMVRKSFDEEFPVEKASRVERAWKKLGLIPQDMDLREFMVSVLSDSIGGYYDPKSKELYLIRREGGAESPMNKMTKAMYGIDWDTMATIHELTHALQDQHFDLETIPTDMEGNDDLVTAMQSVFEGEANYVMYEHVMSRRGMSLRQLPSMRMFLAGGASGSETMNKAPEVIKRGLMFPYMEGMVFVHEVLRTGQAWETVEALYSTLPLSTEQILHPEKFHGEKDWPQRVSLPDLRDALGREWKMIENNALGELNTQILLGEFISRKKSPKTIAKAAAGWDGDRFAVWENGQDLALVWYSTWDTEEDAEQFAKAAVRALNRKTGADGITTNDKITVWKGGTCVDRRGTEVLWVETAGMKLDPVRDEVWKSVKKAEIRRIDRKAPPAPLADNDLYQLAAAPKGSSWKAVEDGDTVTVTWKGLDGQVTFRPVPKKGREPEDVLDAELDAVRGELEGGKKRTWEPEGLVAGSAGGKDGKLGDVRVGIVVLEAKKRYVVATLACSKKDWEKAEAVFLKIVKGYKAK